jgi:DNA-binding IclR family transcriptional regulator
MNSAERTLAILELICDKKNGLRITEIAQALDQSSPSIYYYIRSLMKTGFIYKDLSTQRYRATYKVVDLGSKVIANNEISEISYSLLSRLSEETHSTIHMALKEGNMGVCISKVGHSKAIPSISRIGEVFDLFPTALGKAILSFLDKEELNKYLDEVDLVSFTENTITDKEELRKELLLTKQRGYSIDNQEHMNGLCSLGVPVFDYTERIIGSISVSLLPNFSEETVQDAFEKMNRVAKELSRRLGKKDISFYEAVR